MPVWHKATRKWVEEGRLVVLGLTQEQHPDRCRLFAQWQQFAWPIAWDPINVLESAAVPIIVAIDEHGIVRSVGPRPEKFEQEFLDRRFDDDASDGPQSVASSAARPDIDLLRQRTDRENTSAACRRLGDAILLWSSRESVQQAIAAYDRARQLDSRDGNTRFRLGVAHRMRHESPHREPADFQTAVQFWEQALAINPNQYIWRRRIQQFGPRLDKPYPFYDWVEQARHEVAARGETPIPLAVNPYGSEVAHPSRSFTAEPQTATEPDPEGRIHRDKDELVQSEVTLVPSRIRAGGTARVHITLVPNSAKKAHWNNEAEPLRLWVNAPDGWQISRKLHTAAAVREPTSTEIRRVDFEVQAPAHVAGKIKFPAFALYYVCEDADGRCLFLRQDIEIAVDVDDRQP